MRYLLHALWTLLRHGWSLVTISHHHRHTISGKQVCIRRPAGPAKASYFDRLSEDCLRNVLRHLSTRPRHRYWTAYIAATDSLIVLRSGGTLEHQLRQEICAAGLQSASRSRTGVVSDRAFAVHTDDDTGERLFEDISAETGPGFQRLSVFFTQSLRSAARFRANCANLRSLRLHHVSGDVKLAPILEWCSGKLRSLDIEGKVLTRGDVAAVARHCLGMEKFRLAYEKTETTGTEMKRLWETLGGTLNHFIFRVPVPVGGNEVVKNTSSSWIDDIPSHCSSVTKVDLIAIRNFRRDLASMLRRFGEKLEEVRFMGKDDCFTSDELQGILNACPNAVFDAHVNTATSNTLRVLGNRIRSLSFSGVMVDGLENAHVSLDSLRELSIPIIGIGSELFLEQFLSVPKPCLREIHLNGAFSDLRDLDSTIRHISTIEVISCVFSIYSLDAFSQVCVAE